MGVYVGSSLSGIAFFAHLIAHSDTILSSLGKFLNRKRRMAFECLFLLFTIVKLYFINEDLTNIQFKIVCNVDMSMCFRDGVIDTAGSTDGTQT